MKQFPQTFSERGYALERLSCRIVTEGAVTRVSLHRYVFQWAFEVFVTPRTD